MKHKLKKRLTYLYTGELISVILFIFLSYLLNHTFPKLQLYGLVSFWLSFILFEFLLLQGVLYWTSKLRKMKAGHTPVTPTNVVRLLKKLQTVNIGFIFLAGVGFFLDWIRLQPALPIGGLSLSFFIFVFAILEYINYFHIQLSYDNRSDLKHLLRTKRLKQACLKRDFVRISK
ncbi:hypothetical protein FIU87_02765 [Bacillus sp. THAF10]|uniref:general stress protein n=1 Tax=Bacillus sp. THAF10 TaxID=2587848 RepID=UPI001269759A|nr:general stress protein [Bacillus sp. THAF10]QFT87563.1 hypothetical protein FIU87_02765 [Bacillus sp. THAF10]